MGSRSLRLALRALPALAVVLVGVFALPAAAAAPPSRPFQTALIEPDEIHGPDAPVLLQRIKGAGSNFVRTSISWYDTAPYVRPEGFNPENPNDPYYNWSQADTKLRQMQRAGLQPIVAVFNGPAWARLLPGISAPVDPAEYGRFMKAAALRYNGTRPGLPRVRHWQIWIEPNLHPFLSPQFDPATGQPYSPRIYREMVNSASDALHSVSRDNIVIAGNTAPFRDVTPLTTRYNDQWGPLTFMREFLCLDRDLRPKCNEPVRFDAWGHHPYTSGGPRHQANLPDDVSLGDLPEMSAVLRAGVRAGHIRSNGAVRFFAMEFSWDTNPPDPQALPLALHTRWVAEALYRMWANGITLATWLQIRDGPFATTFVQSGLYFNGRNSMQASPVAADRPKPALTAFRFPLVAFREGARVMVWGRTPNSRNTRVLVEQSFRGGWKRLGIVRTNSSGVFQERFKTAAQGLVRARTLDRSEKAIPFSLKDVPDCWVSAFGTVPGTIEAEPENPRYCVAR